MVKLKRQHAPTRRLHLFLDKNELVGGFGIPTPLKNDWVTWDDDYDEIPKYSQLFLESHNPFMFQSPPGIITLKTHTTGVISAVEKPVAPTFARHLGPTLCENSGPLSEAFLSIEPLSTTWRFWTKAGGLREKREKPHKWRAKHQKKLELTVWWTIFDEKKMIPSGYLT